MALEATLRAGVAWADFWKLTPFQTQMICAAWGENQISEGERTISGAWHTEAFARTKKLPDHKDLFKRKEPKIEQSEEQVVQAIFNWGRREIIKQNG